MAFTTRGKAIGGPRRHLAQFHAGMIECWRAQQQATLFGQGLALVADMLSPDKSAHSSACC